MTSMGTGYDLYTSQFSPDGRVFQVEYANKAVGSAGTAIGLRGKDGVVFAAEKIIKSKLYEPSSNPRLFDVNRNIGCAVTGLYSDCRSLADYAGREADEFLSQYGRSVPLKYLTERLGDYMHAYTLFSATRPFGANVMLGSWDAVSGPQLYSIDPSGVSYGYFGVAAGKAKESAKTEIEKIPFRNMLCKDLVKEAAKIIYVVHDEVKDKLFELELSWVSEGTGGRIKRVPKDVHEEAEKFAKQAIEDLSDSDDDMS
ncbi:Proteasome subunit alpha type [Caligus rogercresseyi]|uniref:Proteasome subunit alpha type n=1 Tax=Caligus rogercresseyi TaxID=217165 RepID=A0A7T8GQB6_CALRO|nr:Proteasome subunit alpha type [Caligus rogercresseyi]|eukprot:TRINITY_DN2772_c0_g1_i1.p1 TRINITY_DN2772_c0_g1~~TRINITY_DN2772_c0_g1_i1.p1  ORF type:complete len:256 (-),score=73.77 TRINITY_DN2772_c0_g1_i1:962-1729(-)